MPRTSLVASAAIATAAAALLGWCAALLAVAVPCAAAAPVAFPRPATPDDFLGLLLWAQATAERAPHPAVDASAEELAPAPADSDSTTAPANQARQLAAQWRNKHRSLFRKNDDGVAAPPKKAPPTVKKHAPAPKTTPSPVTAATTTPPPPPSTTAVHAPALWAPEEAVSRAAMPALEEYDRNERFGHSFIHGFHPF